MPNLRRRQQQIVVQVPDSNRESSGSFAKYFTILLGVGGLATAWYFLSGKSAANQQGGQVQDDVFTQWAGAFKNLIDGYTTDKEILQIIALAAQVTDFPKVSAAYNILSNGNNLENDISEVLSAGQYQEFITNLNKKGASSGASGLVTVAALPVTIKVGDKLLLNNSKKNIGLYLKFDDYGTGKIDLLIGKGLNAAPVTFLGVQGKKYPQARPPFTINVYKVGIGAAQKPYWVSSADILKKVSGLGSIEIQSQLFN